MNSKLDFDEETQNLSSLDLTHKSNKNKNKNENLIFNDKVDLFTKNQHVLDSNPTFISNPFTNNLTENVEFKETFTKNENLILKDDLSNEIISNNPFSNSLNLFQEDLNKVFLEDEIQLKNFTKYNDENSYTSENILNKINSKEIDLKKQVIINETQNFNLNSNFGLKTDNYAIISIQGSNISKSSTNLENKLSSSFNRNENTINEKQLFLASCLLNNACESLPSDHNFDTKSLYLYSIYRHFILQFLHYFLIILHHSLAFFEQLGLCREFSKYDNITITLEIICLSYYTIRLVLRAYILPAYKFYSDMKNLLIIFAIFFTLIDIITYLSIPQKYAYRWSIVLRPLFMINFTDNRKIQKLIHNIRCTLPDTFNILILIFISISVFTLVAVKLFKDVEFMSPNQIKVVNYLDMYYQLFILVTNANSLYLKMSAYNINRWFALFFIIFSIVNVFILMNIILATIYNNFWKNIKVEIKSLIQMQKDSLAKSFEVMVRKDLNFTQEINPVFCENETINLEQFRLLLETYFTCWKLPSKFRLTKAPLSSYSYLIQIYWKLLESNSKITWNEYQNICDLLNIDINVLDINKMKDEKNNLKFFKLYESILSKKLIKLTKNKYFKYFFDALILLNSISIVMEIKYIKQIECAIILIFVLEILFKIYTFGLSNYLAKFWNVFDLIVIGNSILTLSIIQILYENKDLSNWMEIFMLIRVIRLFKLLKKIRRFDVIRKTIINLLPYLLIYGIFLILIFYVYSIIGMKFFRNLITNEIIFNKCTLIKKTIPEDTKAYMINKPFKIEYCNLNFNSFMNSLMLLFDLIIGNQWYVLSDNFELITGSKLTRIYFASFYLVCVIILLNSFTSFILEIFILQYLYENENNLNQNQFKMKIRQFILDSQEFISIKNLPENSIKKENYLVTTNDNEILDADQYLYNYSKNNHNFKSLSTQAINFNQLKYKNYYIVCLSPESSFRLLIKDKCNVETLMFEMFKKKLF